MASAQATLPARVLASARSALRAVYAILKGETRNEGEELRLLVAFLWKLHAHAPTARQQETLRNAIERIDEMRRMLAPVRQVVMEIEAELAQSEWDDTTPIDNRSDTQRMRAVSFESGQWPATRRNDPRRDPE